MVRVSGSITTIILSAASMMFAVRSAGATPITWQASGVIEELNVFPPYPAIGFTLGMPWSLTFTVQTTTPGTLSCSFASATSYAYNGAVTSTVLQIGSYTYSAQAAGTIYTNSSFPFSACPGLGAPGTVQFLWLGGWTTPPGGPNLNLIAPYLLASYNDPKAIGGALPAFPTINPAIPHFLGLQLLGGSSGLPSTVIGGSFQPTVVPEPSSWILVTTASWIFWRRRRSSASGTRPTTTASPSNR
jgi:hypothetical protein